MHRRADAMHFSTRRTPPTLKKTPSADSNPTSHSIRSLPRSELFYYPSPPSPPSLSSPISPSPPSPQPRSLGSPSSPPEKPYALHVSLFRTASGDETPLSDLHMPYTHRTSSVTDSKASTAGSPDASRVRRERISQDGSGSSYSHASAVNLDNLDNLNDLHDDALLQLQRAMEPGVTSGRKRYADRHSRQSFMRSFAKAAKAKSQRAIILSRPELQNHNKCASLTERCIVGFTELLDMNINHSRVVSERFRAFSALFTREERALIAEMLRESSKRLRNETSTPWRSPLPRTQSQKQPEPHIPKMLAPWARRINGMSDDALVRSVVYGTHVIPGVQSAEAVLLRMAGEYQRDEVNRRASRADRLDVPLSFALTLTAALATFARLECAVSYKRYRSRSAAHRRSNPQALLMLKTRYDGLKLSFAVTLHGESPCTILFRRPRTFVSRKIDDYATVVTEAKDLLIEFGREVSRNRE